MDDKNSNQSKRGVVSNLKSSKRRLNQITKVSNGTVLVSSLLLIVFASIETLSSKVNISVKLILDFQLFVCSIFIIDFIVRIIPQKRKFRFFLRNFLMLLVSIPYLNLVVWYDLRPTEAEQYLLRSIPLIRGFYGLYIIIGWLTKSKVSNLFYSYLITMVSVTYYSSVMFYSIEHSVNPAVTSFWKAIWWACMNVTTVGSNIYGVTFFGQLLSAILAGVGMMMFPVFTVFITNNYSKWWK